MPPRVFAQSRKNTLVIGLDISDTITLDPARQAQYTPPMTLLAAYDMLVTMSPGDYITIRPALATKWERTADGKGWRFTLRDGVKFASGNPMTAEDVKWSLDRVLYLGDQPSQYIAHVDRTEIVDAKTVDVILKDPSQPLLTIIAAPGFVIYDSKLVEQHGGDASTESKTRDKATTWLNGNSAGAGAYKLVAWERNAQIQLVRNDNYWRGKPAFERVIIRHIGDSAAQLLSIRRGDIDIAFNLIPEQISTIKSDANLRLEAPDQPRLRLHGADPGARIQQGAGLEKEARQAIGYAIDYDGIIKNLLKGVRRCAARISCPSAYRVRPRKSPKKIGFHRRTRAEGQVAVEDGGSLRRLRVRNPPTAMPRSRASPTRPLGTEDSGRPRPGQYPGEADPDGSRSTCAPLTPASRRRAAC